MGTRGEAPPKDEDNGGRNIRMLVASCLKVNRWAACSGKVWWLIAWENCCEAQYFSSPGVAWTSESNLPQNGGQMRIHPTSILSNHYQRESVLWFGGQWYACLIFWPLRNMPICVPGDLRSLVGHWVQQSGGREAPVLVFSGWTQALQIVPS